jgi:hypothetical protein
MEGFVYEIVYNENNDIRYIGSSCRKNPKDRLYSHRSDYKRWLNGKRGRVSIYPFFKEYGFENFQFNVLKKYKISDKKHILAYEQLYINRLECVNQQDAFGILAVVKNAQQKKQYYEANKEKIAQYQQQYRETNREEIAQYYKNYHEDNRGYLLQQKKQYHEAIKASGKHRCDTCNLNFPSPSALNRHLASKSHIKKVNEQAVSLTERCVDFMGCARTRCVVSAAIIANMCDVNRIIM